jgi:hypothetical protein
MKTREAQTTYTNGNKVGAKDHTEAREAIGDRYSVAPLTYSNQDSFCNPTKKVREEKHGRFTYHLYNHSGEVLAFYIPL